MKIAAFDIEISKEVEGHDWQAQRPLGISCAAVMLPEDLRLFYEMDNLRKPAIQPQMSVSGAAGLVRHLAGQAAIGYTIVTVNGLGFDFQILAEESGMWRECANLALNHHCDLMLLPVAHPRMGWRVGLQTFAEGAGVEGKKHEVTLKSGEVLHGMNGSMAPRLWARGEHDAVLDYLGDDVRATLETAVIALERGSLRWQSRKGRGYEIHLPKDGGGRYYLPTVYEVMRWSPRPDVSWMENSSTPEILAAWALEALYGGD
jgi:hypothetical protein